MDKFVDAVFKETSVDKLRESREIISGLDDVVGLKSFALSILDNRILQLSNKMKGVAY